MIRQGLLVVAALLGALAVGCGHAAVAEPVAPVREAPPAFTPDQDVPLRAPDEVSPSATSGRLTTTKTIGGGPDDTAVDGARPPRGGGGGGGGGAPRFATGGNSYPRVYGTRGYVRSTGTGGTTRPAYGAGTPTGAAPPVGGNFAPAPSFGPAAAR